MLQRLPHNYHFTHAIGAIKKYFNAKRVVFLFLLLYSVTVSMLFLASIAQKL